MDSHHIINAVLLVFLANLLASGASSSPKDYNNIRTCLINRSGNSNSSISDVIYTSKNSSYKSILQPLNLRPAKASHLRPLLIITPIQESQIQAAILCSREHNLQIRIRSGGHDFEGLSYTSRVPFIIVDMRNLRSISINAEEKTAWIEAGATLGELYYTIARISRTLGFGGGVTPPVGVGGLFSGGGYSMMSRKFALASDRIIDAKLITADGELLDRGSMSEDLFWAIRGGGGGSFGIVVAFKVELVTVPETVTVFNVSRTAEQNATALVHRWQYIADKVDDDLLLRLFLRSITSPASGKRTVIASFTTLFLGRVRDLMPMMQEKFPELGLVEEDCTEMSWIESKLFFAGLWNQPLEALLDRTVNGFYFKDKSDYVKQPFPVHALRGIWRFLNQEDENMAQLEFSPYGGAFNKFSELDTPFPHRAGNVFMIEYVVLWNKAGTVETERHLNWMKRLYRYAAPYVSSSPREAYVNYRDLDIGMNNIEGNTSYEQASVWGRKYFKNNFARLVRAKTDVDPSNFFRNEQSIPPLFS